MPAGAGSGTYRSPAEILIERLMSGADTPYWEADPVTKDLGKWIAFRDSDRERLRHYAGWKRDRQYKVDPLPEKISMAFADFLYGEDPEVFTAAESDAEMMLQIIEQNNFPSELRTAVDSTVAEGEYWFRLYRDLEQADVPVIEWHSRTEVVPLIRGRQVVAAAFVQEVDRDEQGRFMYVETHEIGAVHHNLFYQRTDFTAEEERTKDNTGFRRIGDPRSLETLEITSELEPVWVHGLDEMLCGRVMNRKGRRGWLIGESEYHSVEDLLFDLNEAHTVDTENFRLAGKKRAVVPRRFAKDGVNLDAAEEIFWADTDNEMEEDQTPIKILEYTYNGAESIARKDDLTGTILTRVGLARQFVDANANEGTATSGTALRTRLMPTTLAAQGKGRVWDDAVPKILRLAQMLDGLPENLGGFGRSWSDATTLPAIERTSILPEDDTEEVNRHTSLVAAELESTQTAIEELHPDWDEDRVNLELARLGIKPVNKPEDAVIEEDEAPPPPEGEDAGAEEDEAVVA